MGQTDFKKSKFYLHIIYRYLYVLKCIRDSEAIRSGDNCPFKKKKGGWVPHTTQGPWRGPREGQEVIGMKGSVNVG